MQFKCHIHICGAAKYRDRYIYIKSCNFSLAFKKLRIELFRELLNYFTPTTPTIKSKISFCFYKIFSMP